jgi:penicillin-binding protein 1A
LLELSAAYTPFVCNGNYTSPRFIDRIEKIDGTVVARDYPENKRVLSVSTAREMHWMLNQVVNYGTGGRAKGLTGDSGGKTGTSDDIRDAWFIGYNGGHLAGVWVGHDKNDSLGIGENGGRTAAPIWRDYMERTAAFR